MGKDLRQFLQSVEKAETEYYIEVKKPLVIDMLETPML